MFNKRSKPNRTRSKLVKLNKVPEAVKNMKPLSIHSEKSENSDEYIKNDDLGGGKFSMIMKAKELVGSRSKVKKNIRKKRKALKKEKQAKFRD